MIPDFIYKKNYVKKSFFFLKEKNSFVIKSKKVL